MKRTLLFMNRIDCEATQPSVNDGALGLRSAQGYAEILEAYGLKGSFFTIPSEAKANRECYMSLRDRGHEIGLHVHPADQGFEEFLGVYGPEDQQTILSSATELFEQSLGFRPKGICIGYGSSNDHTHVVVYRLGYRHGITLVTGRALPECASVAVGAPLRPYYAHAHNRVLEGDLDFVELTHTIDPASRMWGGKHPQDLRVELVDAKNHYYTIASAIERQLQEDAPILVVHASTHNLYEYGQADDFRRKTLEGIIRHTYRLAEDHGLTVLGTTCEQVAEAYRNAVPLGGRAASLTLDRRGRMN